MLLAFCSRSVIAQSGPSFSISVISQKIHKMSTNFADLGNSGNRSVYKVFSCFFTEKLGPYENVFRAEKNDYLRLESVDYSRYPYF